MSFILTHGWRQTLLALLLCSFALSSQALDEKHLAEPIPDVNPYRANAKNFYSYLNRYLYLDPIKFELSGERLRFFNYMDGYISTLKEYSILISFPELPLNATLQQTLAHFNDDECRKEEAEWVSGFRGKSLTASNYRDWYDRNPLAIGELEPLQVAIRVNAESFNSCDLLE